MPEEDDDALGRMLGDRIKGAGDDAEEGDDTTESGSEADPDGASGSDTSDTASRESTQITQSTDAPATEDERESDRAVRSRSPFPLYVTPELKATVQDRFEKFNAQRTLNDEPQVEKHRHFMEGLLRAGLDHPDLEEYVLDEFTDE